MNQHNTTNVKVTEEALKEVFQGRHATRAYKSNVIIPEETLNEILELAVTAPSAWNLQHWRFLVIRDQVQKDRIKPIAYGQQQVSDASVVVIILGDLEANLIGREMYDGLFSAGFISREVRDDMITQIEGGYQSPQFARDEANKNAGLAAMQLMLAAKAKGYDTGAMGGYNPNALVEALNIPSRFIPVMMITIGEAVAPARPTTRLPLSTSVINESF